MDKNKHVTKLKAENGVYILKVKVKNSNSEAKAKKEGAEKKPAMKIQRSKGSSGDMDIEKTNGNDDNMDVDSVQRPTFHRQVRR